MTISDEASQGLVLARQAAAQVHQFLAHLIREYQSVVEALHAGAESQGMAKLARLTDDLEHFLQFQILIHDYVNVTDSSIANAIDQYRAKLIAIISGIEPALADLDMIEIADALEDDLLPALRNYERLDAPVQRALAA